MRKDLTSDFQIADSLPARRRAPVGTGDLPTAASSDRPADARTRSGRQSVDESAISRLASTVVKVRELRNRFADIESMRRRLEAVRNRTTIRMAHAERAIETAREVGRDFCAARAGHEVQGLRDEAAETNALLAELDLVAKSLDKERRLLASQLLDCSLVAERLPSEPDRSRARQIVADALRRLGATRASETQTFTRGDTKQYGHAR
jgi:hypothetical protein